MSSTRRVHAHVRTLQDECLHTFWLTKTCLCVTYNIWHHLFHLTTHICSRNDVPPHDFNLRTLLCIQLLTHETMSENIGFTDSKDSVHCKKTCIYAIFDLHGHVRVQSLTHDSMSVRSFEHNFPLLRLMRRVCTSCINCKTWQCAILHWKDAFLHYFDLRGRLLVQIFTYEDVYVCNFSHTKSCLRTLVWPTRRTVMCIHYEKMSLWVTFWLTWTCPHVNFLIRGRVCIQIVT